jgi:AcrR family transcriptional regulator
VTLRDAQRELTRSRLIAAAAESFRTRGYAATTIEDIANGAGATRATFYLHFRTKADLVDEVMTVIRQASLELNARLDGVVRSGDRASMRTWLDAAFEFWELAGPLAVAEQEAASLDEGTRRTRSASFSAGVDAMVRGLVGRDGTHEHSRVPAVLAYAQLEGLFNRWMRSGWDIDRSHALEVLTDMWMAALGPVRVPQ